MSAEFFNHGGLKPRLRYMKKTSVIFTVLFLSFSVHAEEFVSLTLCGDRLLAEIARPEQIAAMSPYSQNPRMMLDKINRDKPILEPQLTALLPYLDKTLLINETFYPQLVADLKRLGVKIVPINGSPQTADYLNSCYNSGKSPVMKPMRNSWWQN